MAETNGNRDTRFDEMQRTLEMLIADHVQFRADHKQLLTAQMLQKDAIDQLVVLTKEHTVQIDKQSVQIAALDGRVDRLVAAIGEMISRTPLR